MTQFGFRRRLASAPIADPCTNWEGYKAGAGTIFPPESVDYTYFLSGSYFGDAGLSFTPLEVISTKYLGDRGIEVEMAKRGWATPHVRIRVVW